ncbi:MAG: phosphotransferase [Pseudomonadota bacterium]
MLPDPRRDLLHTWLVEELKLDILDLQPASADASFRRYFRAWLADGGTRIVMDAPPAHEDIRPFLHVAQKLAAHGVHVPIVHAVSLEQGFMLLDDFGSTTLLPVLQQATPEQAEAHYRNALRALAQLQTCPSHDLPPYDRQRLGNEMRLFDTWYLQRHLGLSLGEDDLRLLNSTYAQLTERALAQAQGFVHRDYHSRNLMLTAANPPGIIDFQDAVHGPITYDIASLLRDSYIEWPDETVERWLRHQHQTLLQNDQISADWSQFKTDFDWMSAQRHLKVLGIFARLHHRDGKSGYLADLPLTLRNLHRSLAPYPEFAEFIAWLNSHGCARP